MSSPLEPSTHERDQLVAAAFSMLDAAQAERKAQLTDVDLRRIAHLLHSAGRLLLVASGSEDPTDAELAALIGQNMAAPDQLPALDTAANPVLSASEDLHNQIMILLGAHGKVGRADVVRLAHQIFRGHGEPVKSDRIQVIVNEIMASICNEYSVETARNMIEGHVTYILNSGSASNQPEQDLGPEAEARQELLQEALAYLEHGKRLDQSIVTYLAKNTCMQHGLPVLPHMVRAMVDAVMNMLPTDERVVRRTDPDTEVEYYVLNDPPKIAELHPRAIF